MKLWAKALDPDFAHSERVARLSTELYDGLVATGLFEESSDPLPDQNGAAGHARAILCAAALLHDVGKIKGNKGHHKESLNLIKKHGTPLGWNEQDMQRAAVVARLCKTLCAIKPRAWLVTINAMTTTQSRCKASRL
jgi:exopolyphosphatase/pppGpp-phosphohydrolase